MKNLKEIHEEFEKQCDNNTVASMSRLLVKILCRAFDVSDPEEISLSDIDLLEERLCKYLGENEFKVQTKRNLRYLLNKMLRFNGAQKTTKRPERSHPTTEELSKIYDSADPVLQDFLFIAINTEMRQSLIMNLCWENIDFAKRIIHIPGHEIMQNTPVDVPINDALLERFQEIAPEQMTGKLFAVSRATIKAKLDRAVRKAGLQKRFSPHQFRYSHPNYADMLKRLDTDGTLKKMLSNKDQ